MPVASSPCFLCRCGCTICNNCSATPLSSWLRRHPNCICKRFVTASVDVRLRDPVGGAVPWSRRLSPYTVTAERQVSRRWRSGLRLNSASQLCGIQLRLKCLQALFFYLMTLFIFVFAFLACVSIVLIMILSYHLSDWRVLLLSTFPKSPKKWCRSVGPLLQQTQDSNWCLPGFECKYFRRGKASVKQVVQRLVPKLGIPTVYAHSAPPPPSAPLGWAQSAPCRAKGR